MHRDIKPENLLLDQNYNIKLCDFGWACFLDQANPRQSVCGTFEYMSPEVAENKGHNKKTDIWSLGVLLFELIHCFLIRIFTFYNKKSATNRG